MAFRPIKQWKIAVDGGATAEAAVALAHALVPVTNKLVRQVVLFAKNTGPKTGLQPVSLPDLNG